jgi:hypothetical protein
VLVNKVARSADAARNKRRERMRVFSFFALLLAIGVRMHACQALKQAEFEITISDVR